MTRLMTTLAMTAGLLALTAATSTAQASDPAKAKPVEGVISASAPTSALAKASQATATSKSFALTASFLDGRQLVAQKAIGAVDYVASDIRKMGLGAIDPGKKSADAWGIASAAPSVLGQQDKAAINHDPKSVIALINIDPLNSPTSVGSLIGQPSATSFVVTKDNVEQKSAAHAPASMI